MKKNNEKMVFNLRYIVLVACVIAGITLVTAADDYQLQGAYIELDESTPDVLHGLALKIAEEYGVSYDKALTIVSGGTNVQTIDRSDREEEYVPNFQEPNNEIDQGISGEIIVIDNEATGTTDVYIELTDEVNTVYDVVFDELVQGEVLIGQPVIWHQMVTVHNPTSEQVDVNFNLNNYVTDEKFLDSVEKVTVMEQDNVLSEVSLAIFSLDANETKELDIVYQTSAVQIDTLCFDVLLEDLLPKDAIVLTSEIPLDTVVESRCELNVESATPYEQIVFDLDNYMNVSNDFVVNSKSSFVVEDSKITILE